METDENSSGALRPGEHGWGSHRLQSPGSVRRPLVESECTGNCNRSNCGFLLDVNADANMVCVPVDDDMEGENVQLRRGVRERKRTSKGEAQIAKKTRVAVAAEQDKEGSAAVGKSDRKRASKEEAQNEVAKKKTASKGRVVGGKEVWILRVALGNDAVWVRYASMQEAAEAVKEASYSTADITSIRTIVGKKLNEIPANSKRARCYLGFLWTDDESVSRKDETRDARTAIAEFGEGCWILHEFNGAKWQYFENTSAAAEEVKKVSGYEGQAVRLRKNVTTRLKEREDGETAISYHGYIWTIDSNVGSGSEADALEKYGSKDRARSESPKRLQGVQQPAWTRRSGENAWTRHDDIASALKECGCESKDVANERRNLQQKSIVPLRGYDVTVNPSIAASKENTPLTTVEKQMSAIARSSAARFTLHSSQLDNFLPELRGDAAWTSERWGAYQELVAETKKDIDALGLC